jgi:anion-transporting  ArsA/GET3 family ATPase
MVTKKKRLIRVVFDVLDEMNQSIRQNENLSVAAADPDEAIDWVFAEMQRQFNQPGIRLSKVRICA